jgi:hypothetical protein
VNLIRLIHIAPELPPTVGGVADYTAILSRRLVEVSDRDVEPVLVHAGRESTDAINVDFPVVDLSGECSASALAEAVHDLEGETRRTVVLLEYSNYGYAARGLPFWLLRGLRLACGREKIPLVVMVHELYATGRPWEREFWYSMPQRFILTQLARLADEVITNQQEAVTWLEQRRGAEESTVQFQPVFSNVGEPRKLPPFEQRGPRAVVFGGKKRLIYRDNQRMINELVEEYRFEDVIDIGPSSQFSDAGRSPVRFCGILSSESISEKFLTASIGLISYPGARLSKSGGAAAFASHGLPFILLDEEEGETAEPYVEGTHFWRWSTLLESPDLLNEEQLSKMSRSIRELYMNHMHSRVTARRFFQTFSKTSASAPQTVN